MPLFVMVMYDQIIGATATSKLNMLVLGVVAALALDIVVRRIRMTTLTELSTRLGYQLGVGAIAKILKLPHRMTDRASLSAQVARVKDIERIRGGFSASVLQSAMDLLFVILFAPVIYQIAGWVVLVPIVATDC